MSYSQLPPQSFWSRCLKDEGFLLETLYRPRITLTPDLNIATAGSCFAQHIGNRLKATNARLMDVEPTPPGMRAETAARYGFGIYSARYGNIYTSAQLLQLAEDALSARIRDEAIWQVKDRWYDGLRPRIEPTGFASRDHAIEARLSHLNKVKELLLGAHVLVFTLGLTEQWQHAETGTVFPVWPGAVSAPLAAEALTFVNARVGAIVDELEAFLSLVRTHNPGLKVIFTVSPVPLVATATGRHVLGATQRSKAVLRTAVDEILSLQDGCDYFPSYEIATANPRARSSFEADERQVRPEVVNDIMNLFLAAHPALQARSDTTPEPQADPICEELLLRAVQP